MKHVIVENGYGNFSAYPATLENAKKIFDCHVEAIDPVAIELLDNKAPVLIKESIINVLNKILKLKDGEAASKTITVTKEIKQELVMYCFANEIEVKNNSIDSYDFFEKFKLEDLSFFGNNPNYPKDSIFVDEYVKEQSQKYKVIINDKWKEDAKEIAKVRFILEFSQELSQRDIKYDVVEVRDLT